MSLQFSTPYTCALISSLMCVSLDIFELSHLLFLEGREMNHFSREGVTKTMQTSLETSC